MRTHLFVTAVAGLLAAAAPAAAGPSNAIFASTDGLSLDVVQLVLTTSAGPITIGAAATGWYDQTGAHDPTITNYLAGVCGSSDVCLGDDLARHDFFTFSLSNVTATVTGAQLSVFNPAASSEPGTGLPIPPGYISAAPSLTYTSYDVTTDPAVLTAANTGAVGIYADLGSGTVYATTVVTPAADGTSVTIALNGRAVSDINADRGGIFAVGGAAEVPEPMSAALLTVGVCGALGLRRRRAGT